MTLLNLIKNIFNAPDNANDIKSLFEKISENVEKASGSEKNIENLNTSMNDLAREIARLDVENKNLQAIFLELLSTSDGRHDLTGILKKLKAGTKAGRGKI